MKSASINEIKKELNTLSHENVLAICIRIIKYKKDNKELVNYLLFEAHDEAAYIRNIKLEMQEQFAEVNKTSFYLAKKTIRKAIHTQARPRARGLSLRDKILTSSQPESDTKTHSNDTAPHAYIT